MAEILPKKTILELKKIRIALTLANIKALLAVAGRILRIVATEVCRHKRILAVLAVLMVLAAAEKHLGDLATAAVGGQEPPMI